MSKHTIQDFVDILNEQNLIIEENIKDASSPVENATYNSKEVTPDTLFVCKGATFKEDYLKDAISKGATCYVSEKKYDVDISSIIVKDIRVSMPIIANLHYEQPWKKLNITGITGTKGKSTTAYYIKSIVDEYMKNSGGKESAVISSIDVYDGVINKESHITTPESMELFMHFNNAVNSGISYLTMEVSSQALKYNRVDEIVFDCGIFLNISEDHISDIEHKDFNDYFHSKLRIFKQTKTAFICANSDNFNEIKEASKASEKVITFGHEDNLKTDKSECDVYGYNIKKTDDGIKFIVKTKDFDEEFLLTMPGLFNVENALAAIAVALEYNIPIEYIKKGIMIARSSGRMELYENKDKSIIAVVDYAHNKLSFDTLYSSTKKEYPEYDIYAIFGCPGYKAQIRRRDLGLIAGEYSKKVYICAEDPGDEPVIEISTEIASYVSKGNCPYELIEDRGEAIKKAIDDAKASNHKTIILITGKGNETRQKYGHEYLDCPSDVEYVKRYLQ